MLAVTNECCDGAPDTFLAMDRLAVAGEVTDVSERIEVDEIVLLAIPIDLVCSIGEGASRLTLFGVVLDLPALDGGRLLGNLGVDVAVVLTLTVDTDDATDPRRLRVVELGGISDLAVSNVVDPSLVVDIVEAGRDNPDGGRSIEGPATVRRIVDAWDLTDAALDRIFDVRSLGETLLDTLRRAGTVEILAFGVNDGDVAPSDLVMLDRTDDALMESPGVSFESGR